WAITTSDSAQPRRLFTISIPELNDLEQPLTVPTVGPEEAFFANYNVVPIVSQLAFSREAQPSMMIIDAPLHDLLDLNDNRFLIADLNSIPPAIPDPGTVLNFQPGPMTYLGPVTV